MTWMLWSVNYVVALPYSDTAALLARTRTHPTCSAAIGVLFGMASTGNDEMQGSIIKICIRVSSATTVVAA
jgi:hypothetical protein